LLWGLNARLAKRLVLGLGYKLWQASDSASKCCSQVGYTEVARLCWVSVPLCVIVMFICVGLDGVSRLGEMLGLYLELE